ncbi:MAG: hypothetical protein IIA60_07030 [Candidatus Marinimicrobia bacterium]|nr:hypothetical protein [Candidatus Neomarinimicrobiota bacterium]
MKYWSYAWLLLCSCIFAQSDGQAYPSWFLNPPQANYIIGYSHNYTVPSASRDSSLLDAMAIYHLTNGGQIQANTIMFKGRVADSLGLGLKDELEQLELMFVKEASIQDMYIAQYEYQVVPDSTGERDGTETSGQRISAVGKQPIRLGKLFESWSSAEIEALKELSRQKGAKVRSIHKEDGSGQQVLIEMRSQTRLYNARIERRWVEGNVVHVEVSDIIWK